MLTTTTNTILITGATGFIGSHLASYLVQKGNAVRLFVRDESKLSPALKSNCEIVTGDLNDMVALRTAVKDTSVIFHCAANVKTWDSWDNYYSTNVQGLSNLLNAVKFEEPTLARFVHISSVDVYGFPDAPCDENCPIGEERFGYGKSKILAENLLKNMQLSISFPIPSFVPAML